MPDFRDSDIEIIENAMTGAPDEADSSRLAELRANPIIGALLVDRFESRPLIA